MTKEQYKNKVSKLVNDVKFIEGHMDKKGIKVCNFNGVYAIFDAEKLVYIGSAYAGSRTVAERLNQYLGKSKTGNTLGMDMIESELYSQVSSLDTAVSIISTFSFIAFEHKDIEYSLIKDVDGILNKLGNSKWGICWLFFIDKDSPPLLSLDIFSPHRSPHLTNTGGQM